MHNRSFLDKIFKLEANGTTVKREFLAGLTTFVTMAYVIFVQPNILADAGMPKDAAFAVTIYATVLCSIFMAFYANLPFAVAPAMGINVFFAYYVCGVVGLHWSVALGATFISGIVFFLLTITHLREYIIQAVPLNLKYAIIVGLGFFITMIGLQSSGIIVDSPATLTKLGNLKDPEVALSCFGLLLSGILLAKKVQGALLYAITATTILSMFFGVTEIPSSFDKMISHSIPDVSPLFMQLDLIGAFQYGIISIIFTFTLVEMFDNIGTIIALSSKANLMNKKGDIKGIGKALFVDSTGIMVGAVLGTSSMTTYVESATGIAAGGRTGLTAFIVALLFLLMLLFAPLIQLVPSCATAPALIIVGLIMTMDAIQIKFDDFTEALPAFLMIVMMPLTYSIGHGFTFGFISYAVLKLFTGRAKEVNPIMWIIVACFVISILMS